MDNRSSKRLTIDLRKACDFKEGPIPEYFKIVMFGYYFIVGVLILGITFAIASFAIAKKDIMTIQAQEIHLMSQIRAIQASTESMQLQIQQANQLIEWQVDDIHGQKLLYALFSRLSKEVLLEKFSFKRDSRNHQGTLLMNLKGGYRELHDEFENILSKLELIGLRLITLNQSEIPGGMHLRCTCQMQALSTNK